MKIVRLFAAFTLICFAFSAQMQAVVPPPDGGYPNFTTAEGQNALHSLTSGAGNTALGAYSLFGTTTASFNTAVGAGALDLNTGDSNTAVGVAALLLNTGTKNTAVGVDALGLNASGESNAAVGAFALYSNTDGFLNTAVGEHALFANTTGEQNTAVGQLALAANIDGNHNTATGQWALGSNDHGEENTADGYQALVQNTGGTFNTAVGSNALFANATGQSNTAVGYTAGSTQDTGSGNVYIGASVDGVAGESNHTYIRNIQNTIVSGGGTDSVSVNLTSGLLGHVSSSRRYKEQIKPMDKASEALYRLKPVTYRFKKDIDPTQNVEYGLVAEEVAQVDADLAIRNGNGQIESVRYTAVNAMLLNEFLKEHRKVEQLEARVAQQHKDFDAAVAELKGQIQKVNAQLEVSKAAPQTVLNNR